MQSITINSMYNNNNCNMRNTPSFGMRLGSFAEQHYVESLIRQKPEVYRLYDAIKTALINHPSKETITTDVFYFRTSPNNKRGIIESPNAVFIDTEPVQDGPDAFVVAIQNILRRILDPENKIQFNKLAGEDFSESTDLWWNKYISPIWNDISEKFRSIGSNKELDINFNQEFRQQSGNTDYSDVVEIERRYIESQKNNKM